MRHGWARGAVAVTALAGLVVGCQREELSVGAATTTLAISVIAPTTTPPTTGPVSTTAANRPATTQPLNSNAQFCRLFERWDTSINVVLAVWVASGRAADPDVGEASAAGGSAPRPGSIEAAAAPSMVTAYDEMALIWPDSIERLKAPTLSELAPIYQRAERARAKLEAAGVTSQDERQIATWWESQLGAFDGFALPDLAAAPIEVQSQLVDAGEQVEAAENPDYNDVAYVVGDGLQQLYKYVAAECY